MAYDGNTRTFDYINELVNQQGSDNVTVTVNNGTIMDDGNGGNYFWLPTSTATTDGFKTIQVTGVPVGRWIRSKNANYTHGQSTFTAVALTTSYTFNHNLGTAAVKVFVTPRSSAAGSGLSNYYVSAIGTNTFTLTFSTVPLLGGASITFDWLALRTS